MLPFLKKYGKIKFLTKEGREWVALLLSLLLAFFIWTLHNLSLDYSIFLNYEVSAKSNLQGRVLTSESDDQLMLRAKAKGFYILKHRFGKDPTLLLDIDSRYLHEVIGGDDVFYVKGTDIRDKLIQAMGNEADLEFITTDTLNFVFRKTSARRLPIVPKESISYKDQYMQIGRIKLKPDSVTVFGEEEYVSQLTSIFTEVIDLKQIDASLQGVAKLISPRGVTLSQDEFYYSIDVDRYVEGTISVPIVVVNVPTGDDLISLPSHLDIVYRQPFSLRTSFLPSDFECTLDYNDYLKTLDSKVVPVLTRSPASIYSVSFHPQYVDCIYIGR